MPIVLRVHNLSSKILFYSKFRKLISLLLGPNLVLQMFFCFVLISSKPSLALSLALFRRTIYRFLQFANNNISSARKKCMKEKAKKCADEVQLKNGIASKYIKIRMISYIIQYDKCMCLHAT